MKKKWKVGNRWHYFVSNVIDGNKALVVYKWFDGVWKYGVMEDNSLSQEIRLMEMKDENRARSFG